MTTRSAEVLVSSPGRNFVTLRITTEDSVVHPGNKPGPGVDYCDELAAGFDYTPAYLTAARLLDGTVHDW